MFYLQTLIAFVFAIVLLVGLHELGHLIVARWCGIKVIRFSIGIGKPFYTKIWRNIEWSIAPIPLGGYVKMVDTREGKVADEDLPYAFDKQHPLKRIAVVVAGPLTNLALAIILYAFSFGIGGVKETRPYIGTLDSPSIAAKAGFREGDKIISVNGKAVNTFNDAYINMVMNLEAGKVLVQVENPQGQPETRTIDAVGTPEAQAVATRQASIGISPVKFSEYIGEVVPNKAAAKTGLQKGDRIIRIDGIDTPKWEQWAKIVRENAGRNLKVVYVRNGTEHETILMPDAHELPDRSQIIGRAGLVPAMDEAWQKKVHHVYYPNLAQSMQLGWQKMVDYTNITLSFFGKLITGNASFAHISGPITIAEVAGHTIQIGWQSYVEFLALVSISLGVMNLLPIPVLDGGHLVYYTAELIRGKPLSKTIQDIGLRIGVAALLTMMILAFFNDITRLLG
ncbi:RIP metalloprotease RseP [Wielerella bovis]|uniref:RIP metalloprotease RseP n=1 Tax=Wielerella bovis TaxID=2917790 RepID=UPI002018791E|nr:RIP metalloprotease RseP [Wielerella bovis]ULJ60512.1 RIP metalloprotease RseP [Wielerella bovis]ULJ62721.1 RIP metalloprotease RseP [Wielerella bovis]